jgi:isopenicillin-N epimerase
MVAGKRDISTVQTATADAATTAPSAEELRSLFLLDPEVTFLNHGSYGACPEPVFAVYQRWQRELERQPVEFLGRRYHTLLAEVRAALASYLSCNPGDVVLCDNATSGVNVVARSLDLQPGDEVLTTDHEYGACDLTWQYLHERRGVRIVRAPVDLPIGSVEEVVEAVWSRVTSRTRVLFLSHITSATALRFPIEELCHRARTAGIFSLIDGAHAPGHIAVDLEAIGADAYTGNLHKWLCAPKGSAFLHIRPDHQPLIQAPIVSWGWGDAEQYDHQASQFLRRNEWQGTRDPSAWLAVPAAIAFQAEHDWEAVRERCRELARCVRGEVASRYGLPPVAPDESFWRLQMVACPVPVADGKAVQRALWADHRVEVPFTRWRGQWHVRVSVQGYTSEADLARLLAALDEHIPRR